MKITSDYSKKGNKHIHQNIQYVSKYSGPESSHFMNAIIDTKKGTINIFGKYYDKEYDKTFSIGSTVEYDSYNLNYTGDIKSIGPKTISVDENSSYKFQDERIKRMNLVEFTWRNHDLNLKKIAKENSETMMVI